MSQLIAMAWRNVLRNRRRSLLTASAMALSVAICMAMMAFLEGMYGQMRDAVVGRTLGHVQVQHEDWPGRRQMFDTLDGAGPLLEALDVEPLVRAAALRMYGNALLGSDSRTEGAQLLGVLPDREDRVRDVARRVIAGSWLPQDADHQMVVGVDLAERLEVQVGDELVAVTQASDGSLGNDLYTVGGIVRTGSPALDRAAAFVHLDDLAVLLSLQGKAHEIVLLAPDDETDTVTALTAAVATHLQGTPLRARPWWEVDPTTEQLFAMQDVTGAIMIFFFFGVSAVGVVNTLLMSVFERTREFGVMRAVGMRPSSLVLLVVFEAVVLGAMSVAAGLVLGLAADAYLVTQGLDLTVQGQGYELGNMTFDPIVKARITAASLWQPVVGVFLFCVLAAIWPAVRASRLAPVHALREG